MWDDRSIIKIHTQELILVGEAWNGEWEKSILPMSAFYRESEAWDPLGERGTV